MNSDIQTSKLVIECSKCFNIPLLTIIPSNPFKVRISCKCSDIFFLSY